MDGGMRTIANADLAHGHERVVIVAPVAVGLGFMASPRRQAAALTAAGARVALVRPDRAAVRAAGATCPTCRAGQRRPGPGGPRLQQKRQPSGPSGRPDPGQPRAAR